MRKMVEAFAKKDRLGSAATRIAQRIAAMKPSTKGNWRYLGGRGQGLGQFEYRGV